VLFLLISVCLSVAVSVLLKLARRRQLEVTQMVAVNYPVAALLIDYFLLSKPINGWQWIGAALTLAAIYLGSLKKNTA